TGNRPWLASVMGIPMRVPLPRRRRVQAHDEGLHVLLLAELLSERLRGVLGSEFPYAHTVEESLRRIVLLNHGERIALLHLPAQAFRVLPGEKCAHLYGKKSCRRISGTGHE